MFVKLFVVAVSGKSRGVAVGWSGRWRDEGEEVRVSLFESDLTDETEHGNVAAEVKWSEVVVKEGVVGCDVNGVEEGSEKVVDGVEGRCGGVVECTGAGLGDGQDVCLELVDESVR